MKSVGIRGSVVAAVAAIFVLGHGIMTPAHAQQAALAANPELATRGTWDETINYAKDDIVTARGSAWIAKRANNKNRVPGQTSPSTATFWQLFARGFNPLGAWSNATKYQPDDLVTFSGQTFRAKITNTNRQPPHAASWELFAAKGAAGPNTGIGNGSQSAPSISFTGDPDTGIFSPAAGKLALVQDGALMLHTLGVSNSGFGEGALQSNSSGAGNTAVGYAAMYPNSSGSNNTAMGFFALGANITGSNNTAVGTQALGNSLMADNTAVGYRALQAQTSGHTNTAVGATALEFNTEGYFNTAVGMGALNQNTEGTVNTAVGLSALAGNLTGDSNTAVGGGALGTVITGHSNTAIGSFALQATKASSNVGVGRQALNENINGQLNIAIGAYAGYYPTASSNSIFIGNQGQAADTTTIKIGTQGTQLTTFIAGIVGPTPTIENDAIPVLVSSTGQLGTVSSSRRYKFDINGMGDVTQMLAKLRPVTFRYNKAQNGGQHPLQYGLIAEEVAEVFPDLAVFNKEGTPETVKYHLLPSFLLAGYQSQQNTIGAQAEKIGAQADELRQQKEANAALETRLSRLEALLPQTKAASLQ